nr:SbmA/BacA-like family transporter [Campylobacter pinnipediorum]
MESLGVQILDSIMTLIAFTPIWWELSKKVELYYMQDIPSFLVWIALFVSIGGLMLSWLVGIKSPNLEYNNQKVELLLEKSLFMQKKIRSIMPIQRL